jgi:hypothetical protein
MNPAGVLVHHVAGRTRFRIPEKRVDSGYFANVARQLAQCPGVLSVTASQVTGSVLVLHEAAEPDVLVAYARTFDLFDVPDSTPDAPGATRPPAEILGHGLAQLDQWIRTQTGRRTDLRSVALTALVGAALWQTLRGQLLPAGATLIWYALAVASRDRESDRDRTVDAVGNAPRQAVNPSLD